MGKTTKYLVIYDDGNDGEMIFYDSISEIARFYNVPQDKISDIIACKTKGITNSKYSKQTEGLTIIKVSLTNYHLYNDAIIDNIETFLMLN